ncbi:MAG: hypothetical protein VKL39_22285 [Leptolyngbyaceae bacterium]|nr:hypothetical protein [Leptolyngbyaceae bacterium]
MKKYKIFFFDAHIGVFQEFSYLIKSICPPSVSLEGWLISNHSNLIGREQDHPCIINQQTWHHLNANMIESFQSEYDHILRECDAFFVGYPSSFALIFEKYNKPVILLNCVRYDLPFCWTGDYGTLKMLHEALFRMHTDERLAVVSNNLADHDYFSLGNEKIPTFLIPTLGEYANLKYEDESGELLVFSGEPIVTNYSERLIRKSSLGIFDSRELKRFSGIVHIPYEVSTMSMAEHYAGGFPLIFPSPDMGDDLRTFLQSSLQSNYWRHFGQSPPDYLDVATKGDWQRWWLSRADFYHFFTEVNLISSIEELLHMTQDNATHRLRRPTTDHLLIRKQRIFGQWRVVLGKLGVPINPLITR